MKKRKEKKNPNMLSQGKTKLEKKSSSLLRCVLFTRLWF